MGGLSALNSHKHYKEVLNYDYVLYGTIACLSNVDVIIMKPRWKIRVLNKGLTRASCL